MASPDSLNVFLATWNTGLQGSQAQVQDLTSWLLPVLHHTASSSGVKQAVPDMYAIGVQELLPVHLALAGLSRTVLLALTKRIQSLLSAHATSLSDSPESYSLVSRVSHGGNALWLFARDKTTQGRIGKPLTSTLGLFWLGMSNKGAVGIRLPVQRTKGGAWETLTFVNTHLEAHEHNIERRNAQYETILSSLIFTSGDALATPAQVFQTSHLFIMGDLNYRLSQRPTTDPSLTEARELMVETDTLKQQQRNGKAFAGLTEGDLTQFAPTYKRIVGKVDGYSQKRIPGYTDRILFASWAEGTQVAHYSAAPEITISDHKPVHAIMVLPPPTHSSPSPNLAPVLSHPPPPARAWPPPTPYEQLLLLKVIGFLADRIVGWPWCVIVLLGGGNTRAGMGVSAFAAMIWGIWWTGVYAYIRG